MQLIFSRSGRAPGPLDDEALIDLYRHRVDDTYRVHICSNFVSTLDGSITGGDGRSGSINTPSDQHVFALHRALADAVLVGAGTVRAEGYRAVDLATWQCNLRAAEGLAPYPTLVIVSASGAIDPIVTTPAHRDDSPAPGTEAAHPVILLTAETATGPLEALAEAGVEVIQLPGEQVDLHRASALLGERGLRRVVCEGGPRLHRDLLAAGLLDEVSLTLSPMMVAGHGLRSTSGVALIEPARFQVEHVAYADDETLFTHYRRRDG